MDILDTTIEKCIHCKKCMEECDFLSKYKIDLAGFAKREELRYSCFLCGKCKQVCPLDLDGREISLYMRKNKPQGAFKVQFMKENYLLKNTSREKKCDLIFLGCNYPGYFPKTSEKIIEIALKNGGDYSIDCCQKPCKDVGLDPNLDKLKEKLDKKSVKRLICLCPNCYHVLKAEVNQEVISVYKYLRELGIDNKIEEKAHVFFPCSDRYNREIFNDIKYFINDYEDSFKSINCCGLGGGARKKEKELTDIWKDRLVEYDKENIYTYCGSCAGIFHNQYNLAGVKNFLSEILGVNEAPSNQYSHNVIKFKFKNYRRQNEK